MAIHHLLLLLCGCVHLPAERFENHDDLIPDDSSPSLLEAEGPGEETLVKAVDHELDQLAMDKMKQVMVEQVQQKIQELKENDGFQKILTQAPFNLDEACANCLVGAVGQEQIPHDIPQLMAGLGGMIATIVETCTVTTPVCQKEELESLQQKAPEMMQGMKDMISNSGVIPQMKQTEEDIKKQMLEKIKHGLAGKMKEIQQTIETMKQNNDFQTILVQPPFNLNAECANCVLGVLGPLTEQIPQDIPQDMAGLGGKIQALKADLIQACTKTVQVCQEAELESAEQQLPAVIMQKLPGMIPPEMMKMIPKMIPPEMMQKMMPKMAGSPAES